MKKGRDKVVALFLAPASDKGRVTLRLGDNMWLYIPDVGQRDPDHEPAIGDRQRLQQRRHPAHRLHRGIQRRSGGRAEGRSTCFRSRPRPATSPTTGSRCGSTRSICCRSTIECYAASGLLLKTLHFSNIKDFGGGIKRPATLETDSPLYKGYKSVMQWSGLKKRDFPDEIFTLNYLPRVEELRK